MSTLRHRNKILAIREYEECKLRLESKPRALFVELTQSCNLRCQMCRQSGESYFERNMSDSLFNKIATELFPTAEIVDLRGWGESVILPNFSDRLRTVISYGAIARVVTNLSYSADNVLNLMADFGVLIGASIDSVFEATTKRFRIGADHGLVMRNIEYLCKIYSSRGNLDKLTVYCTCHKGNIAEVPELVNVLGNIGIKNISLSPVTIDHTSELSLTTVNTEPHILHAQKNALRCGVKLNLLAMLNEKTTTNHIKPPCLHPWTYLYITYDGRLGFCDHLNGPNGEPWLMGDIHQQGHEIMWNSPRMISLRKEHLEARQENVIDFKECAWCYKNRYIDFEDMLIPKLSFQKENLA